MFEVLCAKNNNVKCSDICQYKNRDRFVLAEKLLKEVQETLIDIKALLICCTYNDVKRNFQKYETRKFYLLQSGKIRVLKLLQLVVFKIL